MNRNFWIIFLLAIILRIFFALITPLNDSRRGIPYFNDERAHLNYVKYIAHNGNLPVQITNVQDGFDLSEYEYYQAPLYYLLVSPFYALGETLSPGFEYLWIRFISLVFSVVGILILYFTVHRFFTFQNLAINTLLLTAFLGLPLRFGSLVTNDSLLLGIVCLYTSLILHILSGSLDRRLYPIGILLAAAGLWSKASFIVVLPVIPLAFLMRKDNSIKKALGSFFLPLLIFIPWILRNYSLYGSLIPLEVGYGPADPVMSSNFFSRLFYTGDYFVRSLIFPWDALWGGWFDHPIWILEAIILILMISFGLRILWIKYQQVFWFFVLAVGLNIGGYILLNTQYFEAEARLIIPALPFLLIILAFGCEHITSGKSRLGYYLISFWLGLPWISALFK